jgi:hypothetical protein
MFIGELVLLSSKAGITNRHIGIKTGAHKIIMSKDTTNDFMRWVTKTVVPPMRQ